ncbi:hypothetical protein HDU91_005800 [Kappamyces sp. JEL0680]|nr:hypothetical protein HDU91_005800 [Kappamyces sp. JEL0680]
MQHGRSTSSSQIYNGPSPSLHHRSTSGSHVQRTQRIYGPSPILHHQRPMSPPSSRPHSPPQVVHKVSSTHMPGVHKSLRYDMLKDGTPIQRVCGDCDSNHTSGHWCQDPHVVGGYICQKCYRRRKRSNNGSKAYSSRPRKCHQCKVQESTLWFKHYNIPHAYICAPCHELEEVDTTAKKCHACGSCKSTKWAQDAKGLVCRKCARQLGATSPKLTNATITATAPSSSPSTASGDSPILRVQGDLHAPSSGSLGLVPSPALSDAIPAQQDWQFVE